MAKETKINYTENDRAIVKALKDAGEGMTLAELNAATGMTFVPGHIVSAMRKGLIVKAGERDVERPGTRKVSTYNFVTADVLSNAEGKPFNYTDGEKAILAAAASIDSPFTLAALASAMGVEKVSSGSTNGLIKKGNITKGEQVDVECIVKSTVGVYAFAADIPSAE